MAIETERKFLVKDQSFMALACEAKEMVQGYLSTDADATVRVRIAGDCARLTVKSRNRGASRNEWEYGIPATEAREMMERCCGRRKLEKTRYIVPARPEGLCWEVDVFHGPLEGLIVAEIELPTEDTVFEKPSFIGEEVTGDPRYYNSALVPC